MNYKIVLKGLKPNTDVYEIHVAFLSGTDHDIDGKILEYIYEYRAKHGYYKVKYVSKEVIPCDN